MAVEKMTEAQIQAGLKELPGWQWQGAKLHRELKFKDFVQAWGFMTQAAMLAEKASHHPDWSNGYSRVVIDLTTHEVDGLSRRDFDLAQKMNQVLAAMALA